MSAPYGPPVSYPSPGYAPNAYAPSPYGAPAVTYAPPGWSSVPKRAGASQARTAAVLFWLCAVRDLFMIPFVIADGPFLMRWAGLPFSDFWVLALVPTCGLLACAYCAMRVRNPKDPERTTVVALVALGASTFPGIAVLGPVGALLSMSAVGLYFKSKRLAREAEGAPFQGAPPNA